MTGDTILSPAPLGSPHVLLASMWYHEALKKEVPTFTKRILKQNQHVLSQHDW